MAYLETRINSKDTELTTFTNEVKSLVDERRLLQIKKEDLTDKEKRRLKVIEEEDLPEMRKDKDRLVAEIAKHEKEFSDIRNVGATVVSASGNTTINNQRHLFI
jgi:vancomycin resistance protein YoaR